ncbi:tripartite tricarboxylate transporter substrate binding protein [Bengtsoniella intestinalis]|uniref:tripartite tricarboxylate transporter substrate binding protein n=1 Tax=Bengtsoniella intestinalis TaxID=3073143 RepID=UPI00391F3DE5
MRKSILATLLAGLMLLSTGCSSSTTTTTETTTTTTTTETTAAATTTESTTESGWTPTEDITFIVPYEAGGNSDIPARVMVQYMNEYSDVEISVTNITGSSGRTGFMEGMDADPDGTTIMLHSAGFIMQYGLGLADFTYEDAEPIGYLIDSTMAVVVSADSPYETMDDFIAAAAAAPGEIKFGSVSGTLPLFGVLQIEEETGVEFNKVDLSSNSKAPELLSGRIDGYIDGFGSLKQYIDSGDFRCLGIIGSEKQAGYEDIPTFEELGFENYGYLKQDFGVWAPAGTPTEAVEYINNLIQLASENPDCIADLAQINFAPKYATTEQYTQDMVDYYAAFEEAALMVLE